MAYLEYSQRSYRAWEPASYATDEIKTIINVSTGDLVGGAFMRITEAFNGSNADATLELGDAGVRSRFVTTTNSDCVNAALIQGTGAGLAVAPAARMARRD